MEIVTIQDLLDTPTTVWDVLRTLNVATLSQARMMNGLGDQGLHDDSGAAANVFKVHLQSVSMVLDGVFNTRDFDDYLRREKLIEGVYLDWADLPDPYADVLALQRRVVRTWQVG